MLFRQPSFSSINVCLDHAPPWVLNLNGPPSTAVALEKIAEPHINFLLKALTQPANAGPTTRSQANADPSSTAASTVPAVSIPPFLTSPLESLHLDGMNSDQIWEQLELRTKNVLKVLEAVVVPDAKPNDDDDDDEKEAELNEEEEGSEELEDEDDEGMEMDMDDIDMYNGIDDDDEEGLEDEEGEEEDVDNRIGANEEKIISLRDPDAGEIPDLDLDRARGGRSLGSNRYIYLRFNTRLDLPLISFVDPLTQLLTTASSPLTTSIMKPKSSSRNPAREVFLVTMTTKTPVQRRLTYSSLLRMKLSHPTRMM